MLEVLPRDDLFQTPIDELFTTVMAIVQIQERNKIRVFLRKDLRPLLLLPGLRPAGNLLHRSAAEDPAGADGAPEGQRLRILDLLLRVGAGTRAADFAGRPEKPHRHRPAAAGTRSDPGLPLVARRLLDLVVENFGEAQGTNILADFPKGFPAGYRERFAAHSAVVDLQHVLNLSESKPLAMSFYQPLTQVGERILHCKLYHADTPLALSDVLPILENLGLRVLGEFPYRLRHANGREYWIHDFAFTYSEGLSLDIQQLNDTLQDAFIHIVGGDAENDAFNRLVLTAGLPCVT